MSNEQRDDMVAGRAEEDCVMIGDFELDEDGKVARREGEDFSAYMRRHETILKPTSWPNGDVPAAGGILDCGLEWRAYPGRPLSHGGLNGYVRFPERPREEHGYDSLYDVPVHGGITYYKADVDGGCVFGFDTMHYRSEEFPRHNADWIREECEGMANGIIAVCAGEDPVERDTLPDTLGLLARALSEAVSDD